MRIKAFFMCSMLTESVNIVYYIEKFSMQQNMLTDYVNMEHMKNAIVFFLGSGNSPCLPIPRVELYLKEMALY